MWETVEIPVWAVWLTAALALIGLMDRIIGPTLRWYFRRRVNRAIDRLNERLRVRIQPFKLTRRRVLIDRLVHDPRVMEAVEAHATETGMPREAALAEVERYAREIVPSFSAYAYFAVGARVSRWIAQALYRVRLGAFDAAALGRVDPGATIVFVMNHRSNVDYLLVTYLASSQSALSYAVGEWARVWPLSRIIRAMGAYFIRRRSRNDLYRRVLARYVQLATDGGVTQAVFPEGGLSLDGALAPPKLGLLKYIVEGRDNTMRDVVFVPVALNYDRVFEDRILVAAGQKGERRFRARISVIAGFVCKQLWLRITGRYHRHGYAAVSFGTPLALSEFRRTHPDAVVRRLGQELMRRIGAEVPVLPTPLVARALLEAGGATSRAALDAAVARMVTALPRAHVYLPRGDLNYSTEVGLRTLRKRGFVTENGEGVRIVESERPLLEYYAASIAHLFRARSA